MRFEGDMVLALAGDASGGSASLSAMWLSLSMLTIGNVMAVRLGQLLYNGTKYEITEESSRC